MDRRTFLKLSAGMGAAAVMQMAGFGCSGKKGSSAGFTLPELPYLKDALEPFVSARTVEFHYGKHHQGYVNKLNRLMAGSANTGAGLEELIRQSAQKADMAAVYNNAAQVFNHTFYWNSIKPGGGGEPAPGPLADAVSSAFGDYKSFRKTFLDAAVSQFGSGWAWLVQDGDQLKIIRTANADTPVAHGLKPILTLDVWEHAYYLDYQNRRAEYAAAWLDHLVNWDFAAKNLGI